MSAQEMESQVSMLEDALLGGKKPKTDEEEDEEEEEEEDDGSEKDVEVVAGGGKSGGGGGGGEDDDEDNDDNDDQEGMDEEKEGGGEDRPSKRSGLKIPLDWWRYKSEKEGEEADNDEEMLGRGLLQGDLIRMGSKVVAFLGLLAHAVNYGDKVLCFSQSIPTLEFLVYPYHLLPSTRRNLLFSLSHPVHIFEHTLTRPF